MSIARADPSFRRHFQSNGYNVPVDLTKMIVRSVISTIEPDRSGDIVVPTGLRNIDQYMNNPIVLWAHQRTMPPVGMCTRLEILSDRIIAETKFSQHLPLAVDLFRLYAEGILRGWSIGFIPRQATVLPKGRFRSSRTGLRIEEWELLEYSVVPIPENPHALTIALEKGLLLDDRWQEWLVTPNYRDVMSPLIRTKTFSAN